MTRLNDLVNNGKILMLEGLGMKNKEFKLLGRIGGLKRDPRVKSVKVEGETVGYNPGAHGHLPIDVELKKQVTVEELKSILKDHQLYPSSREDWSWSGSVVSPYTHEYEGERLKYNVSFSPVDNSERSE